MRDREEVDELATRATSLTLSYVRWHGDYRATQLRGQAVPFVCWKLT